MPFWVFRADMTRTKSHKPMTGRISRASGRRERDRDDSPEKTGRSCSSLPTFLGSDNRSLSDPRPFSHTDLRPCQSYDNMTPLRLVGWITRLMKQSGEDAKRRLKTRGSKRHRLIEERLDLARVLSTSHTTTVTLRLPNGLNEWLDAYIHGAWPERVRKQELVVEALMMLIARRGGPGEQCLESDLVGNTFPS